jgi:two-component system, OmpR family, sensor histidine kinase ChvG
VRGRARSFLSRITVRVLAFNVLVVFAPIAGMLSLGTYERQLLDSLERSLVQQGRVFAAGLENSGPHLGENALRLLRSLRQRREARLRVVDEKGLLLADSSTITTPAAAPASAGEDIDAAQGSQRTAQETFLYRLASFPVRVWRRYLKPPEAPTESDEYYSGAKVLDGPEIADALAGTYGAETRITSGQQSITLYSAIPVFASGRVIGAVLVSQSTYRILSDLYALRLDIFQLFLWSVATAVVLSLFVSATITVPIRRLRDQAHEVLDPRGRLVAGIRPSRARDEVGELSRSLAGLTARLERHVRLLESFAADVSHELKNPLASIRSAAELALTSPDKAERTAMLTMVLEDVSRMERLLTAVREISRIDSGAEGETVAAPVDVRRIGEAMVEAANARNRGEVRFVFTGTGAAAWVPAARLEQVLANLLDNAAGFSPRGGTVTVEVSTVAGEVVIRVCDEGPGVSDEHRDRIFDRFFSFRPGEARGVHAGLGLSIVKAVAEGHGGTVSVANRAAADSAARGACFEVRLPTAGDSPARGS